MKKLTPEQSADIVRYYHSGNNKEARRRGWHDKVPLGHSAIQTALGSESILPVDGDGSRMPLLTWEEQQEGVAYIKQNRQSTTRYHRYVSTPPRTNGDRDARERAAGERF